MPESKKLPKKTPPLSRSFKSLSPEKTTISHVIDPLTPKKTIIENPVESAVGQVLILGPPRTGASSLRAAINTSTTAVASKYHIYSNTEREKLPPEQIKMVVLIYRPAIERYISMFFHTCTLPEYPYFFGTREQVLEATTSELIAHFKKFDWGHFGWINYNYYIDVFNHYFNIPIRDIVNFIHSNETFQVIKGNHESHRVKCVLLKTESLDQSAKKISGVLKIPMDKIPHHKSAQKTWYAQKYEEFRSQFYLSYPKIGSD